MFESQLTIKASDTLESFLSKVAFESDFRKKTCTCVVKTFAIFLLSKETFTIRTCSILESFFRKLLSKATFERKLASVSLPLRLTELRQKDCLRVFITHSVEIVRH